MRISDWSSDVCSSDLAGIALGQRCGDAERARHRNDLVGADLLEQAHRRDVAGGSEGALEANRRGIGAARILGTIAAGFDRPVVDLVLWLPPVAQRGEIRSEEHTSELQSLMRISYAVFCLTKKNHNN